MKVLKFSYILIFSALLCCALNAKADEAVSQEVDNKSYWLCKNKHEVRTIRIHVNKTGLCGTFYSKKGEEKMVGSGKAVETCQGFLDNIKGNLEKSSWACRDITDTKITAALEQ